MLLRDKDNMCTVLFHSVIYNSVDSHWTLPQTLTLSNPIQIILCPNANSLYFYLDIKQIFFYEFYHDRTKTVKQNQFLGLSCVTVENVLFTSDDVLYGPKEKERFLKLIFSLFVVQNY